MEAEAEMVACGQSPWWERPGHWEEGPAKAWSSCAHGQEVPGSAGPSSWGPPYPSLGQGPPLVPCPRSLRTVYVPSLLLSGWEHLGTAVVSSSVCP